MPPGKPEQRSGVLEIAHHEWRELRMQVGRNAYFEMCSFAVVITLQDLPDFVQTRHHRGRLVGHCQFQKLAFWSQGGAQFSQQFATFTMLEFITEKNVAVRTIAISRI